MAKVKRGKCRVCEKMKAIDEDRMCGLCAAEEFVAGDSGGGAKLACGDVLSISDNKEILRIALQHGYLILVPIWIGDTLNFVLKPPLPEDRDYLNFKGY